jgi:DNA invertase Pin-like site-specific DNA recombinase
MVKAFGYLRVSGKGQIDGDGFPRQREAIKRYAKDHGIRIVGWFEEKGVCGATDLEDRPALMAMLEALVSNGTKLVLIEKLDRLARNLMTQETIIGDLRKRGFDLVSVTEPDLLQNDPTRVLMRQIFGAIGEYEKAMIVAKLRGARQRMRARTGRCEGRKPFGTQPGETDTLERLIALRTQGLGYNSIADTANAEGLKPRKGRQWYASTVRRILVAQKEERAAA